MAEVFCKEHKNVLRDISELACSEDFRKSNFGLSYYKSLQNKDMPYYRMTKNGFSFLVMGYTGEMAAQFKEGFIAAFDRYEGLLKNDDYIMERAMQISATRIKALEEKFAL